MKELSAVDRQAGRQTFFASSMLCYIGFICNEMIDDSSSGGATDLLYERGKLGFILHTRNGNYHPKISPTLNVLQRTPRTATRVITTSTTPKTAAPIINLGLNIR